MSPNSAPKKPPSASKSESPTRPSRFRPQDPPPTISASGLYLDIATKTLAPGLIPYSVNAPLWSDNTFKERYLALPGDSRIGFAADSPWNFPTGTVLVKNFALETERNNPKSLMLIETRFLVKEGDQWHGFSYIWDETQNDAVLLEGEFVRSFAITAADNPEFSLTQDYTYPNRRDCLVCHTREAGYALGPRTVQMNRRHTYGATEADQLATLNHIGLFTQDIGPQLTELPRLTDPFDPTAPLNDRARAYLDANCGNCHRPGAIARTILDLRYDTPLDSTNSIDFFPTLGQLGAADPFILKLGEPENSTLYLRMLTQGRFRMPALATALVDEQGAELVRRWIISLGAPTAVETSSDTPAASGLGANYPNPFNSATTIPYQVDASAPVDLAIYDLAGQLVATLVKNTLAPGSYQARWDGTDAKGNPLASGIYFYRLKIGKRHLLTAKMLLLK